MPKLEEIEGIGKKYADKLRAIKIGSQAKLLEAGATPSGRKQIEKDAGVSGKLVLKWINRADLARVKGIGEEFADLLECAGVDTVPALARRNAENLVKKMEELNAKKKLVRSVPTLKNVEKWIAQAKELPRAISY